MTPGPPGARPARPYPAPPRPAVARLLVVVPVHDEEELLAACLASLAAAADAAGAPVDTVVVLDDCRDRSAAVARSAGVRTLAVRAGAVGAARAAGVDAGLALRGDDPRAVWIACTDADTVVPPHWLRAHRSLADAGADVVVGTVRPDPRDLTPRQVAAWRATRVPGRPNGHVHGANLGMRADAYRRAGGFAPLVEHEDVDLVARLRAEPGVVVRASDEVDVVTSGRTVGRTPGGYAGYLRDAFPA
ncbi:glycosyltransferase [Cellulomonas sp.]|uniref:glycosyltransferase n=1 Tax=Cellulomonas sp. TaxID=40001 RepID=UPI002D49D446|nr:glycosyltransferase [Cellulomonas sp.]HYQ73626.1 glycosyltransferase [Cellulomonas sp.]